MRRNTKLRNIFLALLYLALLPSNATADPVTFEFSASANTEMIVDGLFNSAYASNDTIEGSMTFDDVLFAQLSSSYFAAQEFPDAHIQFTLFNGVPVETRPVVEQTYYSDLYLSTGASNSAMNFFNLSSSDGLLLGAFMQLAFNIDGQVSALADIPGNVEQIHFTWNSSVTNGFVNRFYTDVMFEQSSISPVPEPSTLGMLLTGLGLLGFVVRHRKQNALAA